MAHSEDESPSFYFSVGEKNCRLRIAHSGDDDSDDEIAYTDEDFSEDEDTDTDTDTEESEEEIDEDEVDDSEEDSEVSDVEDTEDDDNNIQHSADGINTKSEVDDILETFNDEQRAALVVLLDLADKQRSKKLAHSDDEEYEEYEEPDEELSHSDEDPSEELKKTLNTFNDDQKAVAAILIDAVLKNGLGDMNTEDKSDEDEEDDSDEEVKHSLYEGEDDMKTNSYDNTVPVVTRDIEGLMKAAIEDHESFDKFSKAVIAHSAEFGYGEENEDELMHAYPTDSAGNTVTYGVADIGYMFPEARLINNTPITVNNNVEYVNDFKNAAYKTPYAKVKTLWADITEDEARAKGYIKGEQKLAEVFQLFTRETPPATIYKLQKFDNDDLIDLASNVNVIIPFVKNEMEMKLDEELVNAALVGDGRAITDHYKIKEDRIRPIAYDNEFFAIPIVVEFPANADTDKKAAMIEDATIRARKNYRGSGNPTFYITSDRYNDLILRRDSIGRRLYNTDAELSAALRVKKFVECYALEGKTKEISGDTVNLEGIIVNPVDYCIGTDQGGKKKFMDGFDIDFNQQKYLLETRLSGALYKPKSAIVVWSKTAA